MLWTFAQNAFPSEGSSDTYTAHAYDNVFLDVKSRNSRKYLDKKFGTKYFTDTVYMESRIIARGADPKFSGVGCVE